MTKALRKHCTKSTVFQISGKTADLVTITEEILKTSIFEQ